MFCAGSHVSVAEPDSVNITQPAYSNTKSCCLCVGHSRPGAIQDHHHCLLPWGYGLHSHVRHHQWGIFRRRAGLVSHDGLLFWQSCIKVSSLGVFALCPSSLPSLSLPSVSVWQACYVVSVCASLSGLRIKRWLVKVMALVHLSHTSVCSWTVNFCQAQMLVTSDDAFMSKQATLNWLQKPGFWVRIPVLETSTFST